MNGENSVISFSCNFCGQKIRVAKTSAGKKGKCPKCGKTVLVPDVAAVPSPDIDNELIRMKQDSGGAPQENPAEADVDQLQLLRESMGWGSVKQETPPQRKLPWLIDIFFYPANIPGVIFLVIVILIPLILDILMFLLGIFAGLIAIPSFILYVLVWLYSYWYLVQCIRDSGLGGIRAPNTIAETPGIVELLQSFVRILLCLILCASPAVAYIAWSRGIKILLGFAFTPELREADTFLWFLMGFGVFYYLMSILAVSMFDSIEGISPLIIIPSIFSTFFQYCGLVLIIVGSALVFVKAREMLIAVILHNMPVWILYLLEILVDFVKLYLLMIAAHLLGRFYFRYQEKLNWDV